MILQVTNSVVDAAQCRIMPEAYKLTWKGGGAGRLLQIRSMLKQSIQTTFLHLNRMKQ